MGKPLEKKESDNFNNTDLLEVVKESNHFFPSIKMLLECLIALPCTTSSVERTFSSLRRIKTWLRSTMSEDRLNGLALMSIHRKKIKDINIFSLKVLEEFSKDPRKLLFK